MKIIAFSIIILIAFLCLVYSIAYSKVRHLLDYDNEKHIGRLIVCIVICLAVSVALVFLPPTVWPIPVMVLLVTLFSNQMTGLVAGTVFTMISVLASGQSVMVFGLYFSICLVTVLLFQGIDEEVRLVLPMVMDLLGLLVIETVMVGLSKTTYLTLNDFIFPLINIVICLLLETLILSVFCNNVIFEDREIYLTLNDTEFSVLKECRQVKKEVYMHAVHTAYLTEKIAEEMGIFSPCMKTAAYYFRIGEQTLETKKDPDYYRKLCKENRFPKEATELILQCVENQGRYLTKQEAVVCLADGLINRISELLQERKGETLSYETIIAEFMEEKEHSSAFDECEITKKEIRMIKKTMVKESLYYDFLR